jgi:hypothetical protein
MSENPTDGNSGMGIEYPTGTGMGIIFYPRMGPVPNPNPGGYGRGYFFPPTSNPSGTQN